MLCHDQSVPDFGPMQLVPDFGPMQLVPNFGPMQRARPWLVSGLRSDAVGKAQYVLYMYCMVCGSLGELTKLRAYGFQFWFQVLSF